MIAQKIRSNGQYGSSDAYSSDSRDGSINKRDGDTSEDTHYHSPEYVDLSPSDGTADSPTLSHITYVDHSSPSSEQVHYTSFQESSFTAVYGDNVQYAQEKVYEEKNFDFPYSETIQHSFSEGANSELDDGSRMRGVYNSYDMEDLPHHSTTMVDYPRKLVTILICIAFFIANMDTSILRQTYAHSAASGTRVLSTLGNVTPAWVFSVTRFLWSSCVSAFLFFCQPAVIVCMVILFLLYIYMLTSNEPIFSAHPDFIEEAEKHYQAARKCHKLEDRKSHLMISLCLLGRNFPGPSKVKMFFLIGWQVVRILSHYFLLGYYIEKILLFRDTYKKSSLKACVIYADLLKRCSPACSATEMAYLHLALINTSISLNNSVLQANSYALAAAVLRYKYPTTRFLPDMMHHMAWRAAKTQHDVFGMCYLLGYSMLQRLTEGRWKEARSFGRVLSTKCDEVSDCGKSIEFLKINHEKEPIPMEDIHCVPLTFSLIEYALGNYAGCSKSLTRSLRIMRSYNDVISVQHESKICWLILAQLQLLKNELDNAMEYLNLWKSAKKRGFHAKTVESTYYGLKALVYYRKGDKKKSLEKAAEAVKYINTNALAEPPVWILLIYPSYLEALLLLWQDERQAIIDDIQKSKIPQATIDDVDSYYNSLLKLSFKQIEFTAHENPILRPHAYRLRANYYFIKNQMDLALKNYNLSHDWCEKTDMPYEKANAIFGMSKVLRVLGTTTTLKGREATSEQLLKSAKSIYNKLETPYEAEQCDKELSVVYGRKL